MTLQETFAKKLWDFLQEHAKGMVDYDQGLVLTYTPLQTRVVDKGVVEPTDWPKLWIQSTQITKIGDLIETGALNYDYNPTGGLDEC